MTIYTPVDLLAKYHCIRKPIPLEDFYSHPQMSRVREMWCAANFAQSYEKNICRCLVRIDEEDSQDDVDFELGVNNQWYPFQVAEVMQPGRRRGDEYRKHVSSQTSVEDWDRGTVKGPEWIHASIQRKLDKKYSRVSLLNLLLYLNFVENGLEFDKIRNHCEQVSFHFNSVWLLNNNTICCIKSAPNLKSLEGWLSR